MSIGLSVQKKKWKIDFQDRDNFSVFFLSVSHPNASYQVWSQQALGLGEEAKIDFQDGHHGGHLGFLIGTILVIFDL